MPCKTFMFNSTGAILVDGISSDCIHAVRFTVDAWWQQMSGFYQWSVHPLSGMLHLHTLQPLVTQICKVCRWIRRLSRLVLQCAVWAQVSTMNFLFTGVQLLIYNIARLVYTRYLIPNLKCQGFLWLFLHSCGESFLVGYTRSGPLYSHQSCTMHACIPR